MKKFHPTDHCPKCGGTAKDVEFHVGARVADPENLEVTCRTCGYRDFFAPLDAASETAIQIFPPILAEDTTAAPEHNEC